MDGPIHLFGIPEVKAEFDQKIKEVSQQMGTINSKVESLETTAEQAKRVCEQNTGNISGIHALLAKMAQKMGVTEGDEDMMGRNVRRREDDDEN